MLNKIYFLVQAITKYCAHIGFEHENCQLIYPNGAVFNITQRGCLYYLKKYRFCQKCLLRLTSASKWDR